MKSKWAWALLVIVMGAGVYGGAVLATPAGGLTTTTLAKATVDDLNLAGRAISTSVGQHDETHVMGEWRASIKSHGLSDLYIIDNKIAPGGTTGWHSHPGPSLIFVVAGTVTNYASDDPSCAPHVYSAGSSLVDGGGNDSHMLRNEGTVVAETIAVQFLPQGSARRTDVPVAPSNCPS